MNNASRPRLLPARRLWSVLVLASLLAVAPVCSEEVEPRPAIDAPLAATALVLDFTEVDGRLFAVGERGHVLISDEGQLWRQAEHVPVRATLTRITHADGQLWAVGHDTTIITSRDGGGNWELQYFAPELEQPLLDVLFFDDQEGLAIGAYGLYMTTDDGGANWHPEEIAERVTSEAIDWGMGVEEEDDQDDGIVDDDSIWDADDLYDADMDFDRGCYEFMECHLNQVTALSEQELMIAAERGYGFRSTDRGETWESFRFPYPGSMFGILPMGDECVVAFGLRGNIQKSCDFGDEWEILDTGTDQNLMGGARSADGTIIMVGASSTEIILHQDGRLEQAAERLGTDYATVIETAAGRRIRGGENGVQHD